MVEKSRSARIKTAFLPLVVQFLIGILLAILVTGGGKVGPVDFVSLSAWAIPLALIAFLCRNQKNFPFPDLAWTKKTAQHPYALLGILMALLGGAHLLRMMTLNVDVFDAGFLYQPIFHAFSKPFLACDACYRGTFLAVHQAFTLPVLTPFAAIAGTPLVMPVLAAGVGFLIFYAVGLAYRRDLTRELVFFLFFAILSIRGFREGFVFDLREDILGALFFAWGLYFARKKGPYFALAPFVLAALSKETGVILFPFAGLSILIEESKRRRKPFAQDWKPILLYGVASIFLFVFVFLISLPAWSPQNGGVSDFVKRLSFLGDTPKAIFENVLFHPFVSLWLITKSLLTLDRLKYLVFVVGPFLPFLIRGWNFYYLPGLVLLAGNLISVSSAQRMMQFHYELYALSFFAFGLAESLRRMKNGEVLNRKFLTCSLFLFLSFSGTWPVSHIRRSLSTPDPIVDFLWARLALNEIPVDAPLLGEARTYPMVTDRRNLRYLGEGDFRPEAASLLGPFTIGDSQFALLRQERGNSLSSKDWRLKDCGPKDILCLYERISGTR